MDPNDFDMMLGQKKKKGKDTLLKKFHGEKENKEFSAKRDVSALVVQKIARA
jgi:hypothetical protein